MKWWIPAIFGIILILGNITSVHAWGVAYGDTQIAIQKGETHEIRTNLQNMVGNEEIIVSITLRGDTEIAKLSKTEATLPPETKSYPIYITITVPSNAPKDQYIVTAIYIQKGKGGIMVNLAMEKTITFTIDASGNTPKTNTPNNNNAGTSSNQPLKNEPEEEIIQEQPINYENQDNQIPAVPNITEEKTEQIEEKPVENGWWIWGLAIIIIGIIWFLWWDGWI
jgi:hypothetical protein